jgi:hypothetical protein
MDHLSKMFSQFCIALMKWQFVVTHTIRQTGIPALLYSWVTKTPPVKILCKQNFLFVKKIKIKKPPNFFLSVSFKTVYWWVKTNRCFVRDMLKTIMFIYCRYVSVVADILTVHWVVVNYFIDCSSNYSNQCRCVGNFLERLLK